MASRNSIYIFVKGKKGKYAYEITDNEFNQLYITKKEDLRDHAGNDLWQNNSDFEAIVDSLVYVGKHRGENGIPIDPAISLYRGLKSNGTKTYAKESHIIFSP